ncbi:MAG: right-handed parallel beta-helix repeat-containing protein [Prevotella sp.]|nr:right-handed parallel beta-helix repeat-containing protein [Prevotella sp.]
MKRIFYLLTIAWCLVACQDDDTFSTSTGLRITFPQDTLKLDTVFSRTPSSTYTFWVYNQNDTGIRMERIRLRRGNQTGYRVNVDGIYLDNANGSQTSDVEIRRNDSILVFVELTPSETGQPEPVLLEDDLLFTLESGVEQKVCLQAWVWDAQRIYSPVISKDSLIESTVPLVIYGDMLVEEGATLTIRNTTLFFHDGAGLDVRGTLRTEDCVMRGDRLDDMFDYLPYDRVSGQWNGIRIRESSQDNVLLRTEIRNPRYGIVCDSAAIDMDHYKIEMEQCVIHNCEGAGLTTVNAIVRLDHCQLTNTGGDCFAIYGGVAEISHCTFAQFYPFSAERGVAFRFTNYYGDADIPLYVNCTGSILTGYAEDVVMGDMHGEDEGTFDYAFKECLMRTPEVADETERFVDIIWETPKDSIEGKKHFVTIDEDNLIYDFHLDSLSTAKGLGCY